jgi:hypothetical protein
MEIVWKNHRIRKQAEKIAQSDPIAGNRLKQLEKSPCFLDIPASAQAHFLTGDLAEYFAIDFHYPARLICEPVGEYKKEGGQYTKETIVALEVIAIEKDYH